MASDFTEKNERRRRARAHDIRSWRRSREARKRFGRNGAFGNLARDSHEYQLCESGRKSALLSEEDAA